MGVKNLNLIGTGKRGIGLGWDDKELRSKNYYIVCLFYGPSFIIALRRQINDNPEFSFVVGYLLRLVFSLFFVVFLGVETCSALVPCLQVDLIIMNS
jgi:hypothetical protein